MVLPSKGTASEVAGIVSATMFKNTVKLSNIVTPVKMGYLIRLMISSVWLHLYKAIALATKPGQKQNKVGEVKGVDEFVSFKLIS